MSIKNAVDLFKMTVFPPSYVKWIDKSRAYGAELTASGSPVSSQWFPLDRLQFAPYDGKIINTNHRRIEEAPLGHQGSNILIELGIEGYLRREDALKLYELAFSTSGDVLEAGTNKGLSTSIIAQALHDRGTGAIETIELDPANSDATKQMSQLAGEDRKYGFIFIDHWHGYQATVEAAELVKRLLSRAATSCFMTSWIPAMRTVDMSMASIRRCWTRSLTTSGLNLQARPAAAPSFVSTASRSEWPLN